LPHYPALLSSCLFTVLYLSYFGQINDDDDDVVRLLPAGVDEPRHVVLLEFLLKLAVKR